MKTKFLKKKTKQIYQTQKRNLTNKSQNCLDSAGRLSTSDEICYLNVMIRHYMKLHFIVNSCIMYSHLKYLLVENLFNFFFTVVSCEVPKITNGVHNRQNGLKFGETVTFHCNEGYHLLGEESSTCTQNRRLSPGPPSCEGEFKEFFQLFFYL